MLLPLLRRTASSSSSTAALLPAAAATIRRRVCLRAVAPPLSSPPPTPPTPLLPCLSHRVLSSSSSASIAASFSTSAATLLPDRNNLDGDHNVLRPSSPLDLSGDLAGGPSSNTHTATPVAPGQVGVLTRRFTADDVAAFARVSGDFNAVHFHAVSDSPFDAPIAHGMLVGSTFGTAFAALVPGVIYLQQDLRFRRPVYVGDEVRAEITVRALARGGTVAVCDTTCSRTADGARVIEGTAKVLLPSAARSAAATTTTTQRNAQHISVQG